MSTKNPTPCPPPIRGDKWTQRLIRDYIWKPAVRQNDWTAFAVVGREGSGKSLTTASILQACDPTFNVDRTHFEPVPFLKDIADGPDRPGVSVMGDEFGVGFGKRTWHDREQIEANQALQTARDDNRIVGVTVPRLEELDSQLQGRLHLFLETTQKNPENYVELKFKVIDPSRDGANKEYKKGPKYHIGDDYKIPKIRIGMPDSDYVAAYEEKKAAFKGELYDRVIERFEGAFEEEENGDEPTSPKDIAERISAEDKVDQFIGKHGQTGRKFVNKDLLRAEYELSHSDAKAVKAYLEKSVTA